MSSGFYGWSGNPPLETEVRGTAVRVTGRPGASADSGLGGGTTAGAPTTGTFRKGELVVGQDGTLWVCTGAGSPGTFVQVGAGSGSGTLAGDTDVSIASPRDGDLLQYSASLGTWQNVGATATMHWDLLTDGSGNLVFAGGDTIGVGTLH